MLRKEEKRTNPAIRKILKGWKRRKDCEERKGAGKDQAAGRRKKKY